MVTDRTFNFYNPGGLVFPYGYSPEMYWFRPWFPNEDMEIDYTLYRKGWEIGSGVHIATGNYTKSFTDLSVTSPGVTSDFVRTYNSTSTEEGSFGLGWDFNIDVSKIAQRFSGGGHVRAAGCTMNGRVHDIINSLSGEIANQMTVKE